MVGVNVNGKCYWVSKDDITVIFSDDSDRKNSIKILQNIPPREGLSFLRGRPKDTELTNEQKREEIYKEWERLVV